MESYDLYVFILCLIVFLLLTAIFTFFIVSMGKMEISLIGYGHRDKEIKKEFNKNEKQNLVFYWINKVLSILLCLIFITMFFFAVYIRTTEDKSANGIPSIKVVKSESMATRNYKNTYLFSEDLKNQFQMFDIIVLNHLPKEEDLKLYDIVVYKYKDTYVIHRIIGIEEPNEKHPNERHFLLRGDAVAWSDEFPVVYSQMQGIYNGVRIPFVGSFVIFLQSPAGWLCVILVLFSMIAIPLFEKKIKKAMFDRALTFEVVSQVDSTIEEQSSEIAQGEDETLETEDSTEIDNTTGGKANV